MTEPAKPEVKEFPLAHKIINVMSNLVPEARGHIGSKVKAIESEILKLLPEGAEALAELSGLKEANEKLTSQVDELQKTLNSAQTQIDELTKQAEADKAQLTASSQQIDELNKQLAAKPAETTDAVPPGAVEGDKNIEGAQG